MPRQLNGQEPPPQLPSQPPQTEMDRTTSTEDIPGQPGIVSWPISRSSPAHDDSRIHVSQLSADAESKDGATIIRLKLDCMHPEWLKLIIKLSQDTESNDQKTNGTDNHSRPQSSSSHLDVDTLTPSNYPFEMETTTSMEGSPGQPAGIDMNNDDTNPPGGEESGQRQLPETPPNTPAGINLGQGESGNPEVINLEPKDN